MSFKRSEEKGNRNGAAIAAVRSSIYVRVPTGDTGKADVPVRRVDDRECSSFTGGARGPKTKDSDPISAIQAVINGGSRDLTNFIRLGGSVSDLSCRVVALKSGLSTSEGGKRNLVA